MTVMYTPYKYKCLGKKHKWMNGKYFIETIFCEQRFFSYMAFRVNEVVCVAFLSHSWHVTVKLSHANDFVITKSHAREKPLLAVYRDKKIIMNLKKLKFPSEI